MQRFRILVLVGVLVVGACGTASSVPDGEVGTTTTTRPVSVDVSESDVSTTTTTSVTTTTTRISETTSSTVQASTPSTNPPPPPPNRPPVIEDPGISLSISPSDDFFTLVIDPVATDPDGDDLVYTVLVSDGSSVEFTPPLETTVDMDHTLDNGGVSVLIEVGDKEFATDVEAAVDLAGLEVVGSLADFRLEVTNPGSCFFALGPGGSTTVDREVELLVWYPNNPPWDIDYRTTVVLSADFPSFDLPGIQQQTWMWTHDQRYKGAVQAKFTVFDSSLGDYALLFVPYRNGPMTYQVEFSESLCDFRVSHMADFNLTMNQ